MKKPLAFLGATVLLPMLSGILVTRGEGLGMLVRWIGVFALFTTPLALIVIVMRMYLNSVWGSLLVFTAVMAIYVAVATSWFWGELYSGFFAIITLPPLILLYIVGFITIVTWKDKGNQVGGE